MCLKVPSEFLQIENWLIILVTTYKDHPSNGLAKIINYYLERLLNHTEIIAYSEKRCEYLAMQKYWGWKVRHHSFSK